MKSWTTRLLILMLAILAFVGCHKSNPGPSVTGNVNSSNTDKVYVADETDGTITVLSVAEGKKIATIDLTDSILGMMMPHNVQAAPNGKSVWATAPPMNHGETEYVIVIDPATDKIIKRIRIGNNLHLAHVVLDDESKFAYVTATQANKVLQIDAATYKVKNEFWLGFTHSPHGMRYAQGKLYVACMDSKSMAIIDVASDSIANVPLGGIAMQTAVTPDGKYVFVSLYDTREVVRYDISTGQISRTKLPSGAQGPIQLYPTPDGRMLYVCDQGKLYGRPASDKVYVMDIADMHLMNTITVGNAAHGVVVSKDGKSVYVTNSDGNSVSVIDVNSQNVKATIPVGHGPNGISYWTTGGGMP